MLPLSQSRVTVPFLRGGVCSGESGKFDETYPTALINHVAPAEWQQAIQTINAAIVPPKVANFLHKAATAIYAFGVVAMLYSVIQVDTDFSVFTVGFLATIGSLIVAIPAAIHITNARTNQLIRAVYDAHATFMSRYPQSAWTVQSAHQIRHAKLCVDLMSNFAPPPPPPAFAANPLVYAPPSATAPDLTPPPPPTPHVTYYNQSYAQYPTLQVDHNNIRQPLINY
jgi:hypothetical protein